MRKLLLVVVLCVLPGVAATPAAPAKAAAAKPAQSDAALEQCLKSRFAKSKISADHFTFHVQGGVATVEGKTDVIQHKGSATRIVHACGGQIVNKIQITEAARQRAAANLAKRRGGGGPLKKSAVTLR